jgi:hypothetical protein
MATSAGGGRRTGVRNSETSLSVRGTDEVIRNIADVDMGAVFAAAFVNRRTAFMVLDKSFDYVPYKTGELMASGTVGTGDDFGDNDPFGGRMPSESLRGEGGDANARDLTAGFRGADAITSVRIKVGATMRTVQRYWVGYTAHHANVVHENPYGWKFKQNKGPRPQGKKQSHYLLQAYRDLEPVFSAAHALALEAVIAAVGARADAQARSLKATPGLGMGKMRLVKPGGR